MKLLCHNYRVDISDSDVGLLLLNYSSKSHHHHGNDNSYCSSSNDEDTPPLPNCPQISGEDDLLVLGLSDGALNVFLLHTSPKDPREKLSLVQVERPHESPVALIATKLKKTGAIEKENGKGESAGEAPLLVTAGEDSRLFIFRLVRVGKVTKLEPVGYYQLLDIPERIKIKSVSHYGVVF